MSSTMGKINFRIKCRTVRWIMANFLRREVNLILHLFVLSSLLICKLLADLHPQF